MVIGVHSEGFALLIMPNSNTQWRIEIEMSNLTHKTRFINEKSLRIVVLFSAFCFGIRFIFACGDNKLNSGPKKGVPATISQFAIGI